MVTAVRQTNPYAIQLDSMIKAAKIPDVVEDSETADLH
jgi:hypothetical protein